MSLYEIEFGAKDVAAATRGLVNSGVLRSWLSRGYFPERFMFPRQRGRPAKYSVWEIRLMAITAEFRQHGVSAETAAHAAVDWVTQLGDKKKHPLYAVWRPGFDDFRILDGNDMYVFDVFEEMCESFSILDVFSVVERVDRILSERHGLETAA